MCSVYSGRGPVVGFCEQDNEQLIFVSIEIFLAGWFSECNVPRKIHLYEVNYWLFRYVFVIDPNFYTTPDLWTDGRLYIY